MRQKKHELGKNENEFFTRGFSSALRNANRLAGKKKTCLTLKDHNESSYRQVFSNKRVLLLVLLIWSWELP